MKVDMAFLKLLINVGLIFIATTALPVHGDSAVNYRLPDNVVPLHYNIKLIPYIEENNFTFDGETSANIEIRGAIRNLSLHTLDLTLDEAATTLINSDGVVHTPTTYNYDYVTQIMVLNFDDELLPGIYILNLKFVSILSKNLRGFFRSSYVNEEGDIVWLAASHFEPTWARRAFPCWDEPALKATFNISIKHHRNYTALSNMPMREQSDDGNGDGMIWTHFDMTPVMSTYLVAFVVSDYVRVPNADGTINMWCRSALAPHSKFAQEVAIKSRQILTEYTNSTDKVPKMDHVAVSKFMAGAMENWGLIIYVEHDFAYREGIDTTSRKKQVAVTASHEMAHQWFGNVVSPIWWSHLWLNEGFASFFEVKILNEMFEDWRVMELFVVETQQLAFEIDIAKRMKPITLEANSPREIQSLFSYSSYGKAPAILRMLQHIITEEVFRKGIVKYLHTHQFSSASSDDLWNALQIVLDESDVPHNAYRLKEVMDTWLKQRHYPMVRVTRNYDTNETILTQEHFRPKNESKYIDDDKWWIPITFATQTKPDFSNTLPTDWLRPQDQNITINGIDPDDWIIVNLQQMGYYRVNYDISNWRKIAEYLNTDNYKKIHVLNRAQIIDDAYHFLITKQLDIDTFLRLASYLSQETDYIAWYPMFSMFEKAEDFFQFPETAFIKQYIVSILDELVKNVGYEEDPAEDDFTKLKRIAALKWACTFGHSKCKRMATIKLSEHLADPETNKIPPNLKEWTYCYGAMQINASTWNKLLEVYKNTSDSMILECLTYSEDPDIVINMLNITASDDSIIPSKKYLLFYASIIQRHSDNDVILDYLLMNLGEIVPRKIMDPSIILSGIIESVHSNERFDKIREYVKNYFDEDTLEDVEEMIEMRKAFLLDTLASLQPLSTDVTK